MSESRKDAPDARAGETVAGVGRSTVTRLADGTLLHRFAADDEARVLRMVRLSKENLFGCIDGGVDEEGPWLVRAPNAPTLDDASAPAVAPLALLRSLARALTACEREGVFPGALRPGEVGAFRGQVHLRAESLFLAWLGSEAASPKREAGGRWDSPEVANGAPADNAANRYALGLVVYRAIAGKHPFAGLGRRQAQRASELDPPPFDEAVAASLPPGLQSLVLALLSPRPEDRPKSSQEIVTRIETLQKGPERDTASPKSRAQRTPEDAAKSPRTESRRERPPGPAARLGTFARPWVLAPLALGAVSAAVALGWPKAAKPEVVLPHAAPVRPLARARASDCAPCHAREVSEWERSVMAHAAKSPLFGALESVVEEQNGRDARCPNGAGALRKRGSDVCTDPKSGLVTTGSGGEHWCVSCHAPTEAQKPTVPPWSASSSGRGRAPVVDLLSEEALEGISCAGCHETTGPVAIHGTTSRYEGNPTWTSTATGAVFLSRPEDGEGRPGIANSGYAIDPASFLGASLGDGKAGDPVVHKRSSGSALAYRRSSEFCGSCHDVRLFGTDAIGKDRGEHFKRLRNGYSEWRAWADREAASGRKAATCQDCHMSVFPGVCLPGIPSSAAEKNDACPTGTHFSARAPGEYAQGLVASGSSKPERIFSHFFTSVDVPLTRSFPETYADERGTDARGTPLGLRARRDLLLSRTFRFELGTAKRAGSVLEIPILLENVGAGHRVPAGFSQEREVWVELRVLDGRGALVYEVGRIDDPRADLPDKRFVRVTVRDQVGQGRLGGRFSFGSGEDPEGRPLGVFGADVVDGPDAPAWSPNPRFGGTSFRGKGLINLQNGFLRCVKCIGFIDGKGKCQAGAGQGRTRADRYDDAPYDPDTGECRSNLSGGEELFETYFPLGALDADRGVLKAPDAIVDTRSAPPGVPIDYTYLVDAKGHEGPFRIEARLRFRSFPPFLIRAFAAYEAEHAARGERPSGPQVTLAMFDRIDVTDLAHATTRIE